MTSAAPMKLDPTHRRSQERLIDSSLSRGLVPAVAEKGTLGSDFALPKSSKLWRCGRIRCSTRVGSHCGRMRSYRLSRYGADNRENHPDHPGCQIAQTP